MRRKHQLRRATSAERPVEAAQFLEKTPSFLATTLEPVPSILLHLCFTHFLCGFTPMYDVQRAHRIDARSSSSLRYDGGNTVSSQFKTYRVSQTKRSSKPRIPLSASRQYDHILCNNGVRKQLLSPNRLTHIYCDTGLHYNIQLYCMYIVAS